MNPNAPSWGNNPYAQQQQQGYNPYAQQPPQQQQYNPYAQQQFVPQQQAYNPYAQQQQFQQQAQPQQQQQQQQVYNPYAQSQQQMNQQYNQQYTQQQQYNQNQYNNQQQQGYQNQNRHNQYNQNYDQQQHQNQNQHQQGGYNQNQYNNQQNSYNQPQSQQYQQQQQDWNDSPDDQPQYENVKIAQKNNNTQNDLDKSDDDGQQTQQSQGKNKKRKRGKRKKNKNKNNANNVNNTAPDNNNDKTTVDSKDNSIASSSAASPQKTNTNIEKDTSVQEVTAQIEKVEIEEVPSPKPTEVDEPRISAVKKEEEEAKPTESKPKSASKKESKSTKPKKEDKTKKKESSPKDDKTVSKNDEEKKEEPKKRKKKKVKWDAHDPREHLNLVLIGHVDAGKSTISGQILLATNQIDERTIAKYKKEAKEKNRESWWIAYIMDEDDEERNKGKTVECGRAHFDTDTKRYTILDAPGHKNYVPNMISGAQQADVAILVISARRGEFEAGFDRGGQTREHGLLAITLGITRIVVVVNKMDCCKWKKPRYDDIKKRVTKFLVDDIGYKKKYIDFLPISGQTATNIKTPVSKDVCPWWEGMTLLQTLDSLKKVKRATGDNLRIPVLDRYKGDKGFQAIGKVEAGILKKGDTVMIMPTEVTTNILAISIDDAPSDSVGAGENVLLTFEKGAINFDQIYGGCVICSLDSPTKVVEEFLAEIYIHELPGGGIMTCGYQAMFHCHNVSTMCEIIGIPHKLHKKTMKRSKIPPPFLRSHDRAIARIKLDQKCALEAYDDCGALGRFTLRDQGKTVVIGKIKEVVASKSRLKNKRESKHDK